MSDPQGGPESSGGRSPWNRFRRQGRGSDGGAGTPPPAGPPPAPEGFVEYTDGADRVRVYDSAIGATPFAGTPYVRAESAQGTAAGPAGPIPAWAQERIAEAERRVAEAEQQAAGQAPTSRPGPGGSRDVHFGRVVDMRGGTGQVGIVKGGPGAGSSGLHGYPPAGDRDPQAAAPGADTPGDGAQGARPGAAQNLGPDQAPRGPSAGPTQGPRWRRGFSGRGKE